MVWGAIASGVAGSLASSLLGGKSKPQTTTVDKNPWNAEQLQQLMAMGKDRYDAGPNQYFPDSTVAPLDPKMQQILNTMMGFGDQPLPQAGEQALMQALGGTQGLASQVGGEQVQGTGDYAKFLMEQGMTGGAGTVGGIGANADPTAAFQQFLGGSATNPYTDQLVSQVTNDISQNLNENIMPRIDQGSLNNNAYGGSRQGIAQGKAIDSANQQAGDAATNIRTSMANNDLNRQLSAANSMLGAAGQGDQYQTMLQQMGLQGADMGRGLFQDLAGITSQQASMAPMLQGYAGNNVNTALQGGQINQQYLQSLLGDEVNRFNFNQNADDQNFQDYANLLLKASGQGGSSTSSVSTPNASLGENILGGAATGLGLYGQFAPLFNKPSAPAPAPANSWASNTPAAGAYG